MTHRNPELPTFGDVMDGVELPEFKLLLANNFATQMATYLESVVPVTDNVRERVLLAKVAEHAQNYFRYLGTMHDHDELASF